MERTSTGPKNSDAQILAQLRRRPNSARTPREDELEAVEPVALEREKTDSNESPKEDRAEALKRLVASRRAPKETMSALSPTLRDLRNELISESVARDSASGDKDASLEILEARLDADASAGEPTNVATEPSAAPGEPISLESSVPKVERVERSVPKVELVEPSVPTIPTPNPTPTPARAPSAAADRRDLMVVSGLKKGYVKGKKLIPVLQGVDLVARQGELLAVVGQSGSGKSTLLHLMATLDVPDAGTIHFDGQRIDNLPGSQRDVLRNRFIGMIFQFYHLIPEMTTLENVLSPLMIRNSIFGYLRERARCVERAKQILDLVGLSHRLNHRPSELSGGEMQRASIARALIAEPRVLLADEPTGNLDSKASIEILKLLRKLNDEQKLTIVMVTHDMSQARDADRAIRLVDGRVVSEEIL